MEERWLREAAHYSGIGFSLGEQWPGQGCSDPW